MTMEIWDDKATMAFLRGDGFAGNATREEQRRIRKRARRHALEDEERLFLITGESCWRLSKIPMLDWDTPRT